MISDTSGAISHNNSKPFSSLLIRLLVRWEVVRKADSVATTRRSTSTLWPEQLRQLIYSCSFFLTSDP